MALETECVHCKTPYTLKDRTLEGKKIRCKKCGKAFKVVKIESLDEFDDEIEDYGDDEFGAVGDWPSAGGTPAKPKKKKRTKKSGSSAAWKAPTIIGVSVVAVCLGIWGLIQILPANFSTMFDSHEALIDDSIGMGSDILDAMENLKTQDDVPEFQERMKELAEEASHFEERMLALGTISDERLKEIREYTRERVFAVAEPLSERSTAAKERLKNSNIRIEDDFQIFATSSALRLDWDMVLELPEPAPQDAYSHALVELYRESFPLLLKIKNSSNPDSYISDLEDLTAKFETLSQREDASHLRAGSPYFRHRLKHGGYMSRMSSKIRENDHGTEKLHHQLMQLGSASSIAAHPSHNPRRPF